MEIIVAKFGGTSIGNGERIRKAAESVVKEYMKGKKGCCCCISNEQNNR